MKTVINNGFIIDPKNKIYSKLNLSIENGKIIEISNNKLQGDVVIDADGLMVTPGFVDIHMHEDNYDEKNDNFNINTFESMIKMGVTTAIGGNCGAGPENPDIYLDAVDKLGIPVNFGLLVPHGVLRKKVNEKDKYKKASEENIRKMRNMAKEYLDKGCLGISFGIRYIPGITKEELLYVSEAAKKDNKMVAAHIRDDAQNVIPSAIEFIEVGKKFGVPIQLSHIGSMGAYGQMEQLLSLIDNYKVNGIDIGSDCYPYNAFSTGLGETTYDKGFLDRYKTTYNSIEIAEGKYKGQRLTEDLFFKLRKTLPELSTIAYVMKEEEVDMAISHPDVCVASDGHLHDFQGHPRTSGTFPRFIKKYVKEKKLLNLYQAIEKMTYLPAKRVGIKKGSLGINDDADIVIFNYDEIEDKATFKQPALAPKGLKYVIVGGKVAVKDSKIINNKLGKSIRK